MMTRIRQTKITGRCIICGQPVAHWPDTQEARMVCDNLQCFYKWLLPGTEYDPSLSEDDTDQQPDSLAHPDDDPPVITEPTDSPQPTLPPIPF